MSNEKVEATEEVAKAENAPAIIEGEGGKQINLNELLSQIENAEVGMELVSEYLKFEEGEEMRLAFVEMTQIKKIGGEDGEMTDAARFVCMDGKLRITADKMLVSFGRDQIKAGKKIVPVQITYTGLKGKVGGQYRNFSIKSLLL